MQVFPILRMSHSSIKLLEGAIFISDAHYSFKHPELLAFLKALRTQKIQTPQLILMGDVFDLLFGGISATVVRNQEAVDLINTLSDNIEILYLEGNHDFNLASIFPGVTAFSIKQQPIECVYKSKKIALAHGDFNAPLGYRTYTALIRNPFILKTLGFVNRIGKDFILKGLDAKLERKDDCHEMFTFEKYVGKHLEGVPLTSYSMFIEGHHHQDKSWSLEGCQYVNLPAFACGLKYMRFENSSLTHETFEVEKDA